MRSYRSYSTKQTPQSEPIPGSTQVANSAGGFAWAVDDWTRLDRFLILGSEGGTYYIEERALTRENAEAVTRCIQADGQRAVSRIVEISQGGRAPKNDPAIFALALAASVGDNATRRAAFQALPDVCRIGTHLFHFAAFMEQFRGWGRGVRRSVGAWYQDRELNDLAYQLVKYRQRDEWSHRDLLRLSHPKASEPERNALYHWVVSGTAPDPLPRVVVGFTDAQEATSAASIARLIRDYRLPREAIPTQWLSDAGVWEALLEDMPMTAMIRNLATMTRVGLLAPMSEAARTVVSQLQSRDGLRRARVHPLSVLAALKTYESGRGARGQHSWSPVPQVTDALDAAFYLTFENVEPTDKRLLLALDVSGSMSGGDVAGVPGLTPRVAAAAMALVTAAREPNHAFAAFFDRIAAISISPRERLDAVVNKIDRYDFGRTDCALPMLYAMEKDLALDAFVIYTDSETWYGSIHPVQALDQYRRHTGIPARLIVVGMVSNGFSIADPDDGGMLDVVGFDTSTPAVISDFISGA